MHRTNLLAGTILVLSAVAAMTGCSGSSGPVGATAESAHEHEHDHSHKGVHGGQIIELGEENYHAELTHDDATHKVGVYLYDGTAKVAAPIDAPSITINCCGVGDQPAQYALVAVPQPGDPAGTASYFELVNEELVDGLDDPHAVARLNVTISGQQFVGDIEAHAHEHGHDHDLADDHDHE